MSDPYTIGEALEMSREAVDAAIEEERLQKEGSPEKLAEVFQSMVATEEEMFDPFYLSWRDKETKKERRRKKVIKSKERGERVWTENANFQPLLINWMLRHGTSNAAFEAKVTPTLSLPFNHLQPHQKENLLKVKHGKFAYKISDYGNSVGIKMKLPFDIFMLTGAKAFVAIQFDSKRIGNHDFVLVDIDDFCEEEKNSTRSSLTFERAAQIGRVFDLKT